jgi:hypothetical protein
MRGRRQGVGSNVSEVDLTMVLKLSIDSRVCDAIALESSNFDRPYVTTEFVVPVAINM